MTFEIVEPDEPGQPGAEDEAFRQAQSNLRKAPGDLEARAQFREALRLRRQATEAHATAEATEAAQPPCAGLPPTGAEPLRRPVWGAVEFPPYAPFEIGNQHTAFEWMMLAADLDPNAPWVSIPGHTMEDKSAREQRMRALARDLWWELEWGVGVQGKRLEPFGQAFYRTNAGSICEDLTTSVFDAETMAALFKRVGGHGEKIRVWLSRYAPKSESTEISDEEREQNGVPNTGTDRTEVVPSSRYASRRLIDQIITETYDEEAKNNRKPPNILEIVKPVQNKLKALDFVASGSLIMQIADDPKHAARRGKPGQTMASKKRRAAIDAN